jgi:hypothetical protein
MAGRQKSSSCKPVYTGISGLQFFSALAFRMIIPYIALLSDLHLIMEQFICQSVEYRGFQTGLSKSTKHYKWNSYPSTGQIFPMILEGLDELILLRSLLVNPIQRG